MPNKSVQTWLKVLAIVLVVALAGGLRWRAVQMLPIDYDEDDYLLAGQRYAAALREGDLAGIVNEDYNLEHPPLTKLLYGVVLSGLPPAAEVVEKPVDAPPASYLPQPQAGALRITSGLLGTLEVLFLAILNPLAGLFLGVQTFTIKYTSQIMLEALPALTSLLTVLAYIRSKRRLNVWLILSALMLGCTAASKYLYCVAGIAIALHWMLYREPDEDRSWQKKLIPLLIWGALSLVFFFIFDPFLWADPVGRLKASILYNVNYSQGAQVSSTGYPFWQPLNWLFMSIPWHPGVFLFLIDPVIALFALFGLGRLWKKQPVFVFWLGTALLFLLLWSTKWPQYILILTAPLSLAAAEGVRGVLWDPLVGWVRSRKQSKTERVVVYPDNKKALPWLVPGLVALALIAVFPLIFQLAMSLTDFNSSAIRDGLNGGVWREVWLGITGQVDPVQIDIFSQSRGGNAVHYAGLSLLFGIFGGDSSAFLVFEVIWTVLSVATQLALGVGLALLLGQKGVRFRGWWRTIFILPWIIPEFVGALTWSNLLDPNFGWVSLAAASWSNTPGYLAGQSGIGSWQSNPGIALVVMLLAALWYGFPLMFLAASAGLKSLPDEVYDAAALDGAGRLATFRWLTWPMLLPLVAPVIILRAIFAFNQFYLFMVLNPPYPVMTLSTISYYLFNTGGGGGQYAVSAAINVINVLFLIFLILLFNRWSRASEGVTYA